MCGEYDDEQRRDGPEQKRNQEPEQATTALTLRQAGVDKGQGAPTDDVVMNYHASTLRRDAYVAR